MLVMVMMMEQIEREMMVMLVIMIVVVHMFMTMQIFHVMVMILMFQYHIEVAGVDASFLHPADAGLKSVDWQALQGFFQHVGISAKVEQCRHGHITAYAGVAFQI